MTDSPIIRVLLVFPDEEAASAVRAALAASPEPVDSGAARTVAEALSSLAAAPFDLVVSALRLSDGGAGEIARRFPVVSCVAVGPDGDAEGREAALEAGAIDYLATVPGWTAALGPYVHRLWRMRRRFAAELGQVSRRYENLVDALPDIVYELSPDGRFTFINQAVKTLGYRPEELLGKHFGAVMFDEDVPHVSRDQILPFYSKNKTGARNAPKLFDERRGIDRKTENLEIRLKRGGLEKSEAARSDLIVSVISYGEIAAAGAYRAVGDAAEKVFVGTVGIIRDITMRRKSEEMLRKMYQAVDQSPIAVSILTHDLTIEYVNPAFFAVTGCGPDQAIGRKIGDFLGETDDRAAYEDLVASVRAGIDWRGELRCPRVGAEPFWSSTLVSAIRSPAGLVTHFLCLMEDITRKRALDELLMQAKTDAESASRDKSEFLASVSRELRAPLSDLLAKAETLRTGADGGGSLRSIRESAESMMVLLNDMLELSHLEAGTLELSPEDVDLEEFAAAALAPWREKAEAKGLTFRHLTEGDGYPRFRVDRERLGRIVSNLLRNAVDAAEKGGVEVRFSMRVRDGVPALFVSVRDTGPGLADVEQRKVFKRFNEGMGLALALSKELTFRLGGDIRVESAPGMGSTFSFFVPVEPPSADTLPAADGTEPLRAARSFAVLVAEDNQVNRDYLRSFLEKAGHRVTAVSDGYQAITALVDSDFDIILMDLQMPGMDGIAATTAIRSYAGTDYDPKIPIIALTPFDADETAKTAEKAGFDAYAAKPFNPRAVVSLIDETVLGKIHFDLARLKSQYSGSKDEFRRLLMIAAQDLPKRIALFHERSVSGDFEGAKSALHGAVGMLSSLGALHALQLVKLYRKAVKEENLVFAPAVADDLKRECDGIRKLVRKALDEL